MWSLWACETITASSARGSNENWRFGLFGIDPIGVKQPAVEQDARRADLQQMGAARDLPGRAVERDSQPSHLPTIDRKTDANTSIMTAKRQTPQDKGSTYTSSPRTPSRHATEPHGTLWI